MQFEENKKDKPRTKNRNSNILQYKLYKLKKL